MYIEKHNLHFHLQSPTSTKGLQCMPNGLGKTTMDYFYFSSSSTKYVTLHLTLAYYRNDNTMVQRISTVIMVVSI